MKRKILSLSIVVVTFLITFLAPTLSMTCNAQQAKLDKSLLVTGHSSKFIWTDWMKAPEAMKEATKLIQTNDPTYPTLYDFIQSVLHDPDDPNATVQLSLIDLNCDKIAGIGILVGSKTWCGSAGCLNELYDNAGMVAVTGLNDYEISPALNGVRSSAHKIFPLKKNPKSKYKTNADIPAIFKL
jgi:hypothetical protein